MQTEDNGDYFDLDNQSRPTEPPTTPPVVETKTFEYKPNGVVTESFNFTNPANVNYRISLPSVPIMDFKRLTDRMKGMELDEKKSSLNRWKESSEEALDYYTPGGLYQDRFVDPESEFHQGLQMEDGALKSMGSVKFRQTEGELKGEIALLKVSKILGIGDVINIQLPHSGIWVTLKPATERELLDFWNSLFREKMMLGRSTYGLTLTNFSNHVNDRLFDFIVSHIQSLNYSDIQKSELRNYLLIHDYHILVWGFACSMFPNGYDYERACVAGPDKCDHVEKLTLNLPKIYELDNKALSPYQKSVLLEDRPKRLTLDTYRKYISEHTRITMSSFTLKNGITIYMKVPTFNEYITDGRKWINGINLTVESLILDTVNQDDDDDAKTEALNNYVKSSILRQFSHFIDHLEVEDNQINDRDTINQVLEALSVDDELREEITTQVFKFKAKTTIALIGIPEHKCPKCGTPQGVEDENHKYKNIIPLDVVRLGFFFLTSRISKILEREV